MIWLWNARDQVAEVEEDFRHPALLQVERRRDVDDGGIDRAGSQRGDARRRVADADTADVGDVPAAARRDL